MNQRIDTRGDSTAIKEPVCVPWQPKYRDGVLALFRDVPYKKSLWRWQFESNPFGIPFAPVVLVDGEDRVVGFNGVMGVRATDHGEELQVLWSCDFFLAEHWRGKGLGSVIKHELHQKAPIIMAFGISNRASQVLRHLGWRPSEAVRSYRMLRSRNGLRSWLLTCLQWFNRLHRVFLEVPDLPGLEFSFQSTLPPQELIDPLWSRCERHYGKVVKRNFAYLDWRYQKHPMGRYCFVCAWNNNDLQAILVVRYCRGVLRIVDYCGPASAKGIKKRLVSQSVKHWSHANQVVATTTDHEFQESLLSEGFVQLRGRPRFYIYQSVSQGTDAETDWFIMSGDSDGEFLQAANDFFSVANPLRRHRK